MTEEGGGKIANRTRSSRRGKHRYDPIARIQITEVVTAAPPPQVTVAVKPSPDLLHALDHPEEFHLYSPEAMQLVQWEKFLLEDKYQRLRKRYRRRLVKKKTCLDTKKIEAQTQTNTTMPDIINPVVSLSPPPQPSLEMPLQTTRVRKHHRLGPSWEGIHPCCGQPALLNATGETGCVSETPSLLSASMDPSPSLRSASTDPSGQ
jgi:hypothetical protein